MTLTDAYGNPRRPARFSQCSKLLRLLENGEWWTTRDLLREVPCIVHSRVAELRKRGYLIEHETTGVGAAGSRYRLAGVTERESLLPTAPATVGAGGPALIPDGKEAQGSTRSRSVTPEASTEDPSGDSSPVASASPSPEEPPCEATTGALSSVEQLELVA